MADSEDYLVISSSNRRKELSAAIKIQRIGVMKKLLLMQLINQATMYKKEPRNMPRIYMVRFEVASMSISSLGHLAQVSANNITAVVGTNLKYAHYQEMGGYGKRVVKNYTQPGTGKLYMKKAMDEVKPVYAQLFASSTQEDC